MIIVFEGPDGAGKTTLITHLSQKFNLPIIKMPKAHETFHDWKVLNALSENYDRMLDQIAVSQSTFLVDRGLLSGLVYSKVYNRGNDVSYIWDIIKRNHSIFFIICVGDSDKLLARKKDAIIDPDNLRKINEEYKSLARGLQRLIRRSIVIDTTEKSMEDCNTIVETYYRAYVGTT